MDEKESEWVFVFELVSVYMSERDHFKNSKIWNGGGKNNLYYE